MLPGNLISKFKSRIRSSLQFSPSSVLDSELELDSNPRPYLHSRRRYLINSIPLLSIVALLIGVGISIMSSFLGMSFSVFRLLGWFNGECYAATSASLELGSTSLSTTATQGNTSYLSSTIKATASDIESYTLSITGPVGLSSTNSNGSSNNTTITGANNNKPSTMPNNSWGYAYNDSNSNENKTYQSFTGSTQTLESGTTPSGIAKNITFAAKFSDDAVAGHYTALVHINLVATPKKVNNLSSISRMQEVTPEICTNSEFNKTYTLIDDRAYQNGASNSYTVQKFADDHCWITQNLRLVGASLNSNDSNVSAGYTIPNMDAGSNSPDSWLSSDPDVEYAWYYSKNDTAYYSWATATAGTNPSTGVAASDICPKGWQMPTGGVGGEFQVMYVAEGSPAADAFMGTPYNFSLIGYVAGRNLDQSTYGYWWSRSALGYDTAYNMRVAVNEVLPAHSSRNGFSERGIGNAIRCIVKQ